MNWQEISRQILTKFVGRADASAPADPSPTLQGRLTPWFVMGQVEDQDSLSPFPADERLYPSRMAMLARNFDAARYRPPVIRGTVDEGQGGPAHLVGEWNEVGGYIMEVDFDGVHLWGRCFELLDPECQEFRLASWVARGHLGRSLGWWINRTGVDGGWLIRHLAFLSGEPEGQLNAGLAPLSTYLRAEMGSAEAQRAGGEKYRWAARAVWPSNKEEEDMPLTTEEMQQIANMMATRAQELVPAAVANALPAALKPLTDQLAETQTALRTVTASLGEQAEETRRTGYRTTLEGLVRAMKMDPAELDTTLDLLMAAKPEAATKHLEGLGKRTAISRPQVLTIQGAGGAEELIDAPEGTDLTGLELALRAEAAAGQDADKPGAFRAALEQVLAAH